MSDEILIGLAGLALSVLTYFAGVWRTERRLKTQDHEVRVRRVFDAYMEFRRRHYTAGPDGLLKAGAASLVSSVEILEVCDLVVAHGEKHPLGGELNRVLAGVNLLKFFKHSAQKGVNLIATPLEQVVAESGAKDV